MTSTEVTVDGVECVECEVEGVRVYLFGTAHVSKQSTLDAANLVRHLRPAVVFLELCPERSFLLKQDPNKPIASTPFSMAQLFLTVDEEMIEAMKSGIDALLEEFQQVI
ncbi:hypothetical protein PTSG_05744 [Salpingoeca rosetta]|uniref:TraB domain-containing protein n=1 Tax=Salpingoeca rosetta (strain ATCC 50818 / BSB-021) TaxID=946362 RepID=F2UB39_SALR5|nr:uncharacterized protein PTSG_05744 [Salpingoeca rosetta]EGD74052.1 hypothetical protein PTSG_05744 [Salpingoeca rosetta]|eukprot:XP_004993614.1 hypothetical protein PTSG_05744 [Salpingoeca rosetta]